MTPDDIRAMADKIDRHNKQYMPESEALRALADVVEAAKQYEWQPVGVRGALTRVEALKP